MNLTVNTSALVEELRLLNKIVPTKPAQPALSHILFTAEPMGTRVSLAATDFEISLQTSCPATIDEPGSMLLPASKLLELVDQFPNADVQLTLDKGHTKITCGAFRSRLQSLPPANFPPLSSMGAPSTTVSAASLHTLIEHVKYAVPDKSQKSYLSGALLSLDGTVMALVAVDGRRLAFATAERPDGPKETIIIPSKTLDLLLAHTTTGPVACAWTDRHLFFQIGHRVISSRMMEGKFPGYVGIIPQDNTIEVVVMRSALAAALRRVGLVSDQSGAMYFIFSEGSLLIETASPELGDAHEAVPVQYTGPDLKLCVGWRFVLDFLEAATNPMVSIRLKDASSAMLLTDGDNFFNVVMLMRP